MVASFWLIVGVFIGAWLTNHLYYSSKDGTLNIDRSDPLRDKYHLDIADLDGLSRKRRIVLKVNNKANLSQK